MKATYSIICPTAILSRPVLPLTCLTYPNERKLCLHKSVGPETVYKPKKKDPKGGVLLRFDDCLTLIRI